MGAFHDTVYSYKQQVARLSICVTCLMLYFQSRESLVYCLLSYVFLCTYLLYIFCFTTFGLITQSLRTLWLSANKPSCNGVNLALFTACKRHGATWPLCDSIWRYKDIMYNVCVKTREEQSWVILEECIKTQESLVVLHILTVRQSTLHK